MSGPSLTKFKIKPKKQVARKTNRIGKACFSCHQRKVKCNFEIPCDRCIARGMAHLCRREPIVIDVLQMNTGGPTEQAYVRENEALRGRISSLESMVKRMREQMEKDRINTNSKPVYRNLVCSKSGDGTEQRRGRHTELKQSGSKLIVGSGPSVGRSDSKIPLTDSHWDVYSATMSLLNGGLMDTKIEASKLESNTEEWATVNNPSTAAKMQQWGDFRSDVWNYQLKVIRTVTKSESDLLIKAAFRQVPFLLPIIDEQSFMTDYETYWADNQDGEKHISPFYSKSPQKYMLLGESYALMCFAIHYCEDSLQKQLQFTDEDWDFFPRVLFSCALECLYRGRFMTFMSLRTLQVMALMNMCAQALGGIDLQHCLFGISVYIARRLGLDSQLDNTNRSVIRTCLWWNLTVFDWTQNSGNKRLIPDNSFTTPLPKPPYSSSEYLLSFSLRIASIRKTWFGDNSGSPSLDVLKETDIQIRLLQVDTEHYFQSAPKESHIQYMAFLTDMIVLHELLEVNRRMSALMSSVQWKQTCFHECYTMACREISMFCSSKTPSHFRKPYFVSEYVVSAVIFLLVDLLLDTSSGRKYKREVLRKADTVIAQLKTYKIVIRPAIRGIYVIQRLCDLVKGKRQVHDKYGVPERFISRQYTLTGERLQPDVEESAIGTSTARNYTNGYNNSHEINPEIIKKDRESASERLDALKQLKVAYRAEILQSQQLYFDTKKAAEKDDASDVLPEMGAPLPDVIQDTIQDILSDNGWNQFLASLSELNE